MKSFPGEIGRDGGKHHAVRLNDEQIAWLRRWYPVTENDRLAKAMGLSVVCVRKYAKLNGISKSTKGLDAIRKRQGKRMARTFERLGLYDAKRGHPCSEATLEGNRRRWQQVREGRMKDPITTVKENDPKRFAELMERQSAVHKEIIRKEKLRVVYGLERKTSLTLVVMKPFTRSQLSHRYCALKRGYLLDEDCSEGSEGRYVIWYDSETRRSEKFEENLRKDGFTIRKDG